MTGMEDVLVAHAIQIYDDDGDAWSPPEENCTCSCGEEIGGWVASGPDWEYPDWTEAHAAHVAEALTAAGFGNLHDAWAEGVQFAQNYDSIYPNDNPYPAPKVSET